MQSHFLAHTALKGKDITTPYSPRQLETTVILPTRVHPDLSRSGQTRSITVGDGNVVFPSAGQRGDVTVVNRVAGACELSPSCLL